MALGALGLLGCERRAPPTASPPPRPAPITQIDVPAVGPHVDAATPEARTDRWTRAYSTAAISAETMRAWMAEAALADGESAALALGRRAPLQELDALVGTLPPTSLDPFLRGITRRPVGPIALPNSWRARWTREPPSVALATLIGENPIALDASLAPRSEALLLDGDLTHQIAGARSIQNRTTTLPSVATLVSLHPVAFPLAMRSLSLRGDVPQTVWLNLIATLGARVHPNPRSWGNAWMSLMDALPTTDAAVRGSILALEPVVTQVEIEPASALAAYRCALALRYDRIDQGQRTETCATGPDAWRSLAALSQRARPPVAPALVAEQLRNVLLRGSSDPRVVVPVAQATVLLPVSAARPLLLQLVENRDPGVLAALLEALHDHLPLARSLPLPVLDRLIHAPFDLPEPASLEARLYAIELRRALERPGEEVATTVRALRAAALPDAGVVPQPALVAPPASAGTWLIETTAGTIRVALRADTAPEALRVVRDAIEGGTYPRTQFHRVIPGFVAQGGDPRGDGYGGTTRITPTELSGGRFERGAVGIALAGLDTGGSGFFITLSDSPHLDARYPYLGRVVTGMDVADRLMVGDEITRVAFIPPNAPPSEP